MIWKIGMTIKVKTRPPDKLYRIDPEYWGKTFKVMKVCESSVRVDVGLSALYEIFFDEIDICEEELSLP